MYKVFNESKEIIFLQNWSEMQNQANEKRIAFSNNTNLYTEFQDFINNSVLNKLIIICEENVDKIFQIFV